MAEDKRFYWIKLKDTFMTSDTVDFLMGQKNGASYVVLYQMLCLKTVNTSGELARKIGEIIIPYDAEKIQRDCKYFDIDTIRVALELYKQLGLIYKQEDSILKIANFENMVGSETAWAEKKRIFRENEKAKRLDVNRTMSDTMSKTNSDKRIEIRDKRIDKRDIDNIEETNKEINNSNINTSIKKESPRAGGFNAIISSYSSNEKLQYAIIEFIKMRKLIKKPLTDRALTLTLKELDKLSKNENEKIAILEKSISRCWQGVFPLNSEDKPSESTDINKAIDIINNRRNQAELAQSRVIAELRKDKSFAEAESKVGGLSFDTTKAECQGKDTAELKRQLRTAEIEYDEVLKRLGYSLSDLEIKYTCQKCNDTGFINGQQCECLKKIMEG